MFVRRRPLLRAAVVGGSAQIAGKRPSVPAQPGEIDPEPATPSVSDQLAQLSRLHAQGSLSDAEFAAAKSRLLGN